MTKLEQKGGDGSHLNQAGRDLNIVNLAVDPLSRQYEIYNKQREIHLKIKAVLFNLFHEPKKWQELVQQLGEFLDDALIYFEEARDFLEELKQLSSLQISWQTIAVRPYSSTNLAVRGKPEQFASPVLPQMSDEQSG